MLYFLKFPNDEGNPSMPIGYWLVRLRLDVETYTRKMTFPIPSDGPWRCLASLTPSARRRYRPLHRLRAFVLKGASP